MATDAIILDVEEHRRIVLEGISEPSSGPARARSSQPSPIFFFRPIHTLRLTIVNLESLVQRELHSNVADPDEAGEHAAIERLHALGPEDPADGVEGVSIANLSYREFLSLQSNDQSL